MFKSLLEDVSILGCSNMQWQVVSCPGSSHAEGALSNFRHVLGTWCLVADHKTDERDESVSTGCRRSVMYVGALLMRVR